MHRGFPYLSALTIHFFVFMAAQLCVQGTPTSITASFNNNSIQSTIPDPLKIWFNNHLTLVSGATGPVTIYFQNQTVTFTAGQGTGTTYSLNLPNAAVTIDPSFTSPTTTFYSGTSTWLTSVASSSNNPFLTAYAWDIPNGEDPKSASPVTWAADIYASQPNVSVKWQWSAAVYTDLSTNYNALGVTPINGVGGYNQSGTPGNYTAYVIPGARVAPTDLNNYTGTNSPAPLFALGPVDILVVPEPGSALLVALAGCMALLRRRKPPLSKPTPPNLS